mgnify:CR=1 FL=1
MLPGRNELFVEIYVPVLDVTTSKVIGAIEVATGEPYARSAAQWAAGLITGKGMEWGPAVGTGESHDWGEHLNRWVPTELLPGESASATLSNGGVMARRVHSGFSASITAGAVLAILLTSISSDRSPARNSGSSRRRRSMSSRVVRVVRLSPNPSQQNDAVTLPYIRQIPGMTGIVSALYDVPVGQVWPRDALARLQDGIEEAGLRFSVVESIPVHEDIKLGRVSRDALIDNYRQSIRNMGELGIPVLCYNFMPIFDWTRTSLEMRMPDGSTALAYDDEALQRIDLSRGTGDLPGWATAYDAYSPGRSAVSVTRRSTVSRPRAGDSPSAPTSSNRSHASFSSLSGLRLRPVKTTATTERSSEACRNASTSPRPDGCG